MSAARSSSMYRRQIDRWVAAEIEGGVPKFDDLVCALPGVYPTHVFDSVERLRKSGAISEAQQRRTMERRLPTQPPLTGSEVAQK
jgi:hypothetical protein